MNIVNGSIVNGTIAAVLKTPVQASAASIAIGCFLAIFGGCLASCANVLLRYTQLKVPPLLCTLSLTRLLIFA
jgi:hypothetical protein